MANEKKPAKKKAPAKESASDGKPAAEKAPAKKAPAAKKTAAKKTTAARSESARPALPFPLTELPGAPFTRRAYGVVDTQGREVCAPRWELIGPFADGLATFREDGKTGYVDVHGAVAIPATFSLGWRFKEGRAVARAEASGPQGMIDTTGRWVVPPGYDELKGPDDGVVTARKGKLWGLLDAKTGAVLVPPTFDVIYPWSEGHAVVERDRTCGLTDRGGKLVFGVEWNTLYDVRDGLVGCPVEGGLGFMDLTGKVVIKGPFDQVGPFCEGIARVRVGDQWGYVRRDGSWLVKPSLGDVTPSYKDEPHPGDFQGGLAVWTPYSEDRYASRDYGYLDKNGKRVTEAVFSDARRLVEGRARVRTNAGYGYVGPDGAVAIEPRFHDAATFSQGRARVTVDKKVGFVGLDGAAVVAPRYDQANDFEGGVARVQLGKLWGLIDETGREVVSPRFHLIGVAADGRVPVMAEAPDPEANARELEKVNAALQSALEAGLAETVRPFVRLTTTAKSELVLGETGWWKKEKAALGDGYLTCSKLGGTPYLPEGTPFPRAEDGEPLALLAQLSLAELPALEGFPSAGLLQLFVTADGVVDDEDLTSAASARVVYHADTDEPQGDEAALAHRALPDFPLRRVAALAGALGAAPLSPHVFDFDKRVPAKARKKLEGERVNQGYYTLAQTTGHKLGGSPAFVQDDPRGGKKPYQKFDTLLLQLDSEGDLLAWGDAGIADVLIPSDRLGNGDFSQVLFTWDCG